MEDLLRKQGPVSSKQDYQMSSRTGSNSAHDTQAESQVLSIFPSRESPSRTSCHCQTQVPRIKFLKEQKMLDLQLLGLSFYKGVITGFNIHALVTQVQV